MKKLSIICFSLHGYHQMELLKSAFEEEGCQVSTAAKSKYLPDALEEPLKDWCACQFAQAEGIIFIGATGIAVRTIAPFVASKKTDPAVVVVDELGTYAISLLSGHLGGANALALSCARILGASPIVTTATDLNGRFAVDVFAKKENMSIFRMKAAKEVSAALIHGESVGFYSEFPIHGRLPQGLLLCGADGKPMESAQEEALPLGIAVTVHNNCLPFRETTLLIPKAVILGLGCRRGKEQAAIQAAVDKALAQHHLHPASVKMAASIDLKAKEPGILGFCKERNLPFVTYSQEELEAVEGEFTPSAFVKKIAGVDNVCERSAILAGGNTLIMKKAGENGVTVALAAEDWSVEF